MIKKVRQGCFETNSSSAHSIIVTKNDRPAVVKDWHIGDDEVTEDTEYIYVSSDGKLWLHDIEEGYGRYPFQFLITFEEKLRYAMCEYLGYLYEDDPDFHRYYNLFTDIVHEVVPKFVDFGIDTKEVDNYLDADGNDIMRKDLIYADWNSDKKCPEYEYEDKDGIRHNAILDEENYWESPAIGTIDHQSAGMLKNFLKENNVSLKEFLTNKKYIIVIDGDEYNELEKLMKSGILDKNNITQIYTTSDDDIEYQEWLKEQENYDENDNKA